MRCMLVIMIHQNSFEVTNTFHSVIKKHPRYQDSMWNSLREKCIQNAVLNQIINIFADKQRKFLYKYMHERIKRER